MVRCRAKKDDEDALLDQDLDQPATRRDLLALERATRHDLLTHEEAMRGDLRVHEGATRRDLHAHQEGTRRDLQEHKEATRGDLIALEVRVDQRFDQLAGRMEDLRRHFDMVHRFTLGVHIVRQRFQKMHAIERAVAYFCCCGIATTPFWQRAQRPDTRAIASVPPPNAERREDFLRPGRAPRGIAIRPSVCTSAPGRGSGPFPKMVPAASVCSI